MVNVYEFTPFGRPVTKVRYNVAGDLCFACAKSRNIPVWRTDPLELFGSYTGHNGAVSDMDISVDSKFILTAGLDYHSFIFDVETGKKIWTTETDGPIFTCGISSNRKSFFITHTNSAKTNYLTLYDDLNSPKEFKRIILANSTDVTKCAMWSPFDDSIILCQGDGTIHIYDTNTHTMKMKVRAHSESITDFTITPDGLFGITASLDTTAKLWDMTDMSLVQTFKTPRAVNTAAVSPIKPHLALAGGILASKITTTDVSGHLTQHRFFNYLTGVEFANISGHAGPTNSLRFHPDGHSFVSGAESGTIRFHLLDDKIFTTDRN